MNPPAQEPRNGNISVTIKRDRTRNGERTPLPGQHPFGNGQGSVRPQTAASLILVFCNQTKQAVFFVRNAGSEINAVAEWKQIPEAVKSKRCTIGSEYRPPQRPT